MGYMGFNIKLVGLGSGFAMGMFGNTHYGIEDVALMRAIPGLSIISPADFTEVVKKPRLPQQGILARYTCASPWS